MKRKLLLMLAILCATCQTHVEASVLFTGSLGVNTDVNNFDIDQFDLDIGFSDDQLFPTNLVNLFDSLVITPANIGVTFEANAANDPNFAVVVGRLTDSTDEFIRTVLTEDELGGLPEMRGSMESNFFANGTPPSAPNPAVVTIESISITIDDFVLLPNEAAGPDEDPVNLSLTFRIHGTQIPEPTSGWLAGCGLLLGSLLSSYRRRWV